ncbi:uncharacterized protein LOC134284434 [Aedes albopictus]|uniref:Uncharacterized protein n=1 Tax=Aedes albopictus TaxID=7160 RepID=A0ABM1ZQN9_AEDAL
MAPTTRKGASLRQLQMQLEDITLSFDDIASFIQKFDDQTTASQVEVRLEKIDTLWEKFSGASVEPKSHEDFEDEEKCFEKLRDKVKELHEPSDLEQSVREPSMLGVLDHVRLPQIKLQTFSGEIDEWLSFRDLFTSLIYWRTDLPNVEKFHYLKGCLQGEPKSMVDSLKITKVNYQISWDTLCKRYNNNKLREKKQVQALFKLLTLSMESISELRTLVEGFDRIVQTHDQIVNPADYKNLLVYYAPGPIHPPRMGRMCGY